MISKEPQNVYLVREALRKMANKRNKLNPKNIQVRLLEKTGLDTIALKESMVILKKNSEITSSHWDHYSEMPLAQMHLNLVPQKSPEYVKVWQELVDGSGFQESQRQVLSDPKIGEQLKDMPYESMEKFLNDLKAFSEQQKQNCPCNTTLYEASAYNILGSSKILDFLGERLLQKIGIDTTKFTKGPRYLAVAGPDNPKAVVLVENPHCFETAVQAGTNCAFACSYGFGLSLEKADKHGGMLVENLTTHVANIKRLIRDGKPPNTRDLLSHVKLYFWGDLDLSGLRIYERLKASFPHIQLSALYMPMIEALKAGRCHPYVKATGKEGQKAQETRLGGFATREACDLAELCAEIAVDQEIVQKGFHEFAHLGLSQIWVQHGEV